MLRARNIPYELADRARGLVPGGIGAVHLLARQTGLIEAIDRNRKVLLEAVAESSLGFSGYCRMAAQAMLQAAMETEAAAFVGRKSYERRGDGSSGRAVHLADL